MDVILDSVLSGVLSMIMMILGMGVLQVQMVSLAWLINIVSLLQIATLVFSREK